MADRANSPPEKYDKCSVCGRWDYVGDSGKCGVCAMTRGELLNLAERILFVHNTTSVREALTPAR